MIPIPISMPIPDEPAYSTAQAAMTEAAHAAMHVSTLYESGGAIYILNGQYFYTRPASQGLTTEIDYRVSIPNGARLVALYHTHPGDKHAAEFSDSDKATARRLGLPMYVLAVEYRIVIGWHIPGFVLDAPKYDIHKVTINGKEYLVRGEQGPYILLERDGHTYLQRKSP